MVFLDMYLSRFLAWVSWNFMLALIPVILAFVIYWLVIYYQKHPRQKNICWTLVFLLGIAWLIFLPNTGYLITGWRHFFSTIHTGDLFSEWTKTRDMLILLRISTYAVFFVFYSVFGLFTFSLSIRPLAKILQHRFKYSYLIGIPLFFLVSFGVYLGLIPRLNSWDLFARPGYVFEIAIANLQRPTLLFLIILFAFVLWVGYWFIDIWIDGFLARRRAAKAIRHAR